MHKILILFIAIVVTSASGQGSLIGPSTRNGSFEDGIAMPWGGLNAVNQNAAFASHGEWFGVLAELANTGARTDSYQSVAANPTNGRTFLLTFDARRGLPGFDFVEASLSSLNTDSSYVSPAVTTLMSPTLVSTSWGTYQKQFLFPQSWDGSSVRLDIAFYKFPAVSGTTYFGYFDNITLQQIPEPSFLALLCCGGFLLAARRCLVRPR